MYVFSYVEAGFVLFYWFGFGLFFCFFDNLCWGVQRGVSIIIFYVIVFENLVKLFLF